MEKAIFNTKFVEDENKNGQIVKVLEYIGSGMYLIQFKNKEQLRVYDNELIFIGSESLYN